MEAFLLNPGNATAKSIPPQGGQTTTGEGGTDFSPVMEDAVQSIESQSQSADQAQGEGTESNMGQQIPLVGGQHSSMSPHTDDLQQASAIGNGITAALHSEMSAFPATQVSPAEQIATLLSGQEQSKAQTVFTIQTPETIAVPLSENGTPVPTATSKAESILLQQIQQIIDQGKNNGTITITATTTSPQTAETHGERLQGLSNPLLQSSQPQDAQPKSVLAPSPVVSEEGAQIIVTTQGAAHANALAGQVNTADDKTIASRKGAKLEGAHQDISEQYLNAKIGESKGNDGKDFQQFNQEQNGSEQQSKTDLQTATASTPETGMNSTKTAESGFGQQLAATTTTSTASSGIEGKMAPGANLHVPEREMVENLIKRFNVNPRLQTSKLSMQLHPAELGSLKIDILVQGNSIKTNIVAQSQQIMDTLEKNLPRLREILQDQGFTVDAFEVTLEADGGNQQGLFQENFSSQQQAFSSNGLSVKGSESFDTLLNPDEESDAREEEASGVNITA
jgi:flagellar hook-length control protein FliK